MTFFLLEYAKQLDFMCDIFKTRSIVNSLNGEVYLAGKAAELEGNEKARSFKLELGVPLIEKEIYTLGINMNARLDSRSREDGTPRSRLDRQLLRQGT